MGIFRRFSGGSTSREIEFFNIFRSITSNIELEALLKDLVPRLLDFTDSACGAFYLANNATGKLEIKYSTGFSRGVFTEFDLTIGEGMVGSAAAKKDVTIVKNIPDDSVFIIKTFLGQIKPKNIMLVPIESQDRLMGMLALAGLYPYTQRHISAIEGSRYFIGAAVSNSVIYGRSKRLAGELEFQNKLIADLNRDLETKLAENTARLSEKISSLKELAAALAAITPLPAAVTNESLIVLVANAALAALLNKAPSGEAAPNNFTPDKTPLVTRPFPSFFRETDAVFHSLTNAASGGVFTFTLLNGSPVTLSLTAKTAGGKFLVITFAV